MKQDYRDILIQNLAIIIGGVITGLGVRSIVFEKGSDEFTANSIFWVINFVFILLYLAFVSFGISLIEIFKQIKNKLYNQNNVEKQEADPKNIQIVNSTKNLELHEKRPQNIIEEEKPNLKTVESFEINPEELENSSEEFLIKNDPIIFQENLSIYREQIKISKERELRENINIAIEYTKIEFALYAEDEEIYLLCNYVSKFLEKNDVTEVKPIDTHTLESKDVLHFGWNIWNHYRNGKLRTDVTPFIKGLFPDLLKLVDWDSVNTLLDKNPLSGNIKIQKNLLQYIDTIKSNKE